jgi:hypothetical protein
MELVGARKWGAARRMTAPLGSMQINDRNDSDEAPHAHVYERADDAAILLDGDAEAPADEISRREKQAHNPIEQDHETTFFKDVLLIHILRRGLCAVNPRAWTHPQKP